MKPYITPPSPSRRKSRTAEDITRIAHSFRGPRRGIYQQVSQASERKCERHHSAALDGIREDGSSQGEASPEPRLVVLQMCFTSPKNVCPRPRWSVTVASPVRRTCESRKPASSSRTGGRFRNKGTTATASEGWTRRCGWEKGPETN